MITRFFYLPLLLASIVFSVAHAETREGRVKEEKPAPSSEDMRVAEELTTAGIRYRVDEDKDFHIVLVLEGGRSQQVWVKSVTNFSGAAEMREVWSYAYQHNDTTMPGNMLNRLMVDNNRRIMGSWVKQGQFLLYVVKLPADANATLLAEAIQEAAEVADFWERELSTGDTF